MKVYSAPFEAVFKDGAQIKQMVEILRASPNLPLLGTLSCTTGAITLAIFKTH